MLRKHVVLAILLTIFALILSSCSAPQNQTQGDNDMAMNGNPDNVIIANSMVSKDSVVKNTVKLYQKFLKNDQKCFEGILDKNVVWEYEGVEGTVPFAGTFNGKEGVSSFWKAYLKAVSLEKIQLNYYLHEGNTLHLHWIEWGVAKSTGKKYVLETAQVWVFNTKGQIVRFHWYNDTFAMWNAFQPNTDPQLSLVQHPQDYDIKGDGPVDSLAVVQKWYSDFKSGNFQGFTGAMQETQVIVFAGPHDITPFSGVWYGSEGVVGCLTALLTYYQYGYLNLNTYTTDGAFVDSEWKESFTCRTTGRVVTINGLHSFVINSHGQIAKFRSYNDTYKCAAGYTDLP